MKGTLQPIPPLEPGEALHRRIRAGLLLQGLTLAEWCKAQGVSRQFALMSAFKE